MTQDDNKFLSEPPHLRTADDMSIRQIFGVSTAETQYFVLSNPLDPLPE